MAGQFSDRMNWMRCPECEGRSFSDPLKAFHWPECSRYKEWRFGKKRAAGGPGVATGGRDSGPTTRRSTAEPGVPRLAVHETRTGGRLHTRYPDQSTSELISDKVMDSVLEDLWREVEGSDEW